MGGLEQRLRLAGLRVTQPRLAVLSVLDRADQEGEHLVVAEVAERSREIVGRVSTQGVYECLDALAAAGVVRRVQLPGSPARYETRVDDNHHHQVCLACGSISNVDCAAESGPCISHSTAQDFDVARAEVVYWGTCAACAAGRAALTPSRGRRQPRPSR